MFVAIVCDLGNKDPHHPVYSVLQQYGFNKVQDQLFESAAVSETQLVRLKRELDRLTDSYDVLRFFQFPMENTLVISSLKEKKWRKLIVRA